MLQLPTLPATWRASLDAFRPAFRRSRTFGLFVLLATGLVAQTARRTVVGMLAGAGVAAAVSFHACCRFFSHSRWEADRIGLLLARLIVDRLLDADAAIVVVVDDTLFRRWGRKVFGAFWTHDGSAQDPNALGRGNRWIVLGILVRLPFCRHPVCLPVLLRLWRGKGTASPVQLAGELVSVVAQEFPDRRIHVVGDAAYHGKALLVEHTSITTRLPVNAALYAPAPPRTGTRGRPRLKGRRLGAPADLAATARWRRAQVDRYGRAETVEIAQTPGIWYGAFGNTAAPCWCAIPAARRCWRSSPPTPAATPRRWWPATPTGGRSRSPSPAANNCSASARPATPAARRGTHRAAELLRLQPRHRLVRAPRPPPRRHRRTSRDPALVPAQGRTRLRRHARQTPQNPCRSTN